MRAGSEQFILKDFAFYDSLATPALGLTTIAVYEILRRYVWRTDKNVSARVKNAVKEGKLSTPISRKRIAEMTGLSVRQVQYDLNRLRAVGWIRAHGGSLDGETILHELGERDPSGIEVFYSDGSLRKLWLALEDLAQSQELNDPNDLSVEDRLAFSKAWFNTEDIDKPQETSTSSNEQQQASTTVHTPSATAAHPPGGQPLHTPSATAAHPPGEGCATTALIIREPCGASKINKTEKYMSPARAGEHIQSTHPTGLNNRPGTRDEHEHDVDVEEREAVGSERQDQRREIALDTVPGPSDTPVRPTADRLGTLRQVEAEAIERTRKQRLTNERNSMNREQRAKNLKGRPVDESSYSELKALWSVWYDLISERYDAPPSWFARNGDIVGRQNATKLLKMYGRVKTEQAMTYVVRNWDTIGAQFFKNGSRSLNLGFIVRFHEQLFRDAALWERHREVLEEWEAWWKANPNGPVVPSDLSSRHQEAVQALQTLGLGA